ncbi:MAG: FecR domain-containing protein, partial [Opitutaceae bacterium]|nr:FecR domain-containing protein [Opitutaceae bacterium]
MIPRKLVLLLASLMLAVTTAVAQTVQTTATVARVTGTATVTLADGSTQPLTAGMKLPQGATITTGADGDVFIESHAGYVTSIKADSVVTLDEVSVVTENGQVTEERTMLDLKSGNLVAKLDPKKKAINNYQVRTPKGVAAARGTLFTMSFRGQTFQIAVVDGQVAINPVQSFGYLRIAEINRITTATAGSFLTDGGTGAIAPGIAGQREASARELLAAAVATVALAAQNGIGGTTAAEAAA